MSPIKPQMTARTNTRCLGSCVEPRDASLSGRELDVEPFAFESRVVVSIAIQQSPQDCCRAVGD